MNDILYDDIDSDLVNQYKWCVRNHKDRNVQYAIYRNPITKKYDSMHRLIMNPTDKMVVHHINHNGLDNRRSNLMVVTQSENLTNTGLYKNNTLGYKGIKWDNRDKRYRPQIKYHGKSYYNGSFHNPQDAAKAYDEIAIRFYGDMAMTNKQLGLI